MVKFKGIKFLWRGDKLTMASPSMVLKNYDPNWVLQFEEVKRKILSVIQNKKIQIEHI